MAKAREVKAARKRCEDAIRCLMIETAPWESCSVEPHFFFGCKRRRDEDNLIGSLKAYYDGIVDGGIVLDDTRDHMERLPTVHGICKTRPRVELHITRTDLGDA